MSRFEVARWKTWRLKPLRLQASVLLAVGLLMAFAGGALAASKIRAGSPVRTAKTFILTMVPDSSAELLRVGDSTVQAHCDDSDGVQTAVTGGSAGVDYMSFFGRENPTSDVRLQHLPPGGSELLVAPGVSDGTQSATLTHFAIFDGSGTAAASGTTALFADSAKGQCIVTLQAAG